MALIYLQDFPDSFPDQIPVDQPLVRSPQTLELSVPLYQVLLSKQLAPSPTRTSYSYVSDNGILYGIEWPFPRTTLLSSLASSPLEIWLPPTWGETRSERVLLQVVPEDTIIRLLESHRAWRLRAKARGVLFHTLQPRHLLADGTILLDCDSIFIQNNVIYRPAAPLLNTLPASQPTLTENSWSWQTTAQEIQLALRQGIWFDDFGWVLFVVNLLCYPSIYYGLSAATMKMILSGLTYEPSILQDRLRTRQHAGGFGDETPWTRILEITSDLNWHRHLLRYSYRVQDSELPDAELALPTEANVPLFAIGSPPMPLQSIDEDSGAQYREQ